jgi:small-conductance mechanosensitive channel
VFQQLKNKIDDMRLIKSNRVPSLQRFGLLAAVWILLAVPAQLFAQMGPSTEQTAAPIEIPENLTQEQVRDLIARMSDDQVRELIITQLDKLAVAQDQTADPSVYMEQLREGMRLAGGALQRMFAADDKLHALPVTIWQGITDDGSISGWYLLFQLIGLLLTGRIAERLTRHFLDKVRPRPAEALSLGKRFDLACYGAVMGVVGLGAYAAGALLFVEITSQQAEVAQDFWYQVVWCLVLIKLVVLAVRQIASPGKSDMRLVSVTDAVARQVLAWSMVLAASLVLPLPMIKIATDFGADAETILLARVIFGAVFVAFLLVLVIHLRDYGAKLIAGDDAESGSIREGLSRIWWMLTMVYILLIWFMSVGKRAATGESSLIPGMGSLLLFALIPYFDIGLRWLIARYFEEKEDETVSDEVTGDDAGNDAAPPNELLTEIDESDAIEAGPPTIEPGYIAVTLRYARVLMVLALLAIFVRLWEIDIEALTATIVGERFAAALFDISLTVLLTWALWGVIRISIERKLSDEKGPVNEDEEGGDGGGLGGTRVETILPIVRFFIKITLITMAVMVSLSALGVNIGPLIAGAGVVGIAIGFGAQSLVRDIVSGLFYLIDDAFRIGEYVLIDQIRGTVERISIRSFQLRHHNGPVHTIPYGEIRSLTNYSRDWAIMKFELRIPFETDIEVVRKLIKQVGIEMMEDPVAGEHMLEPLKSQGVNRMDDSALIIRCKFTAVPGQQFMIRRDAFTRIQKAFEANGIQFAPRRVLVESVSPSAAVNAAAAAIDKEGEGESPKSDKR